jgi:hypothetical protein
MAVWLFVALLPFMNNCAPSNRFSVPLIFGSKTKLMLNELVIVSL